MARIKSGFTGERAIVLPTPIVDEYKNTDLGSLLYITDIGFYPKASFHFRKRTKEEASQYILMYCVEGEGWFETNNQIQKVLANQVFILPKAETHSYGSKSKKPWTIYWIHFDGEKAGFFAEGFDKPLLILPKKDSRIEDRFKLFEEIFSTLKKGYSKNNLDFSVTSLFYFLGSLKYVGAFHACNNLNQNLQQSDIVEDAIHFMRENVRKRIALKEIAHYVGFSPSYFSGLFQRKTGYSPLNYFIHLKIQEACHQLDFSDMKINQISMLVGFDDPLYFSRIFTKTMGSSPSEYRKKKKG
ncbi:MULTISPECIES: AraC family transcriptional regulator [unclassified Flavobacterium]|jgi:AraC-like DNA-binding protein/mannose-6-phosphate isomerase-like protein (cupin superfamily)|uniref:AraC family transcriptional regulator n=1 Tax=unclassified Flavobacterium TaxID=196869 RepID=UPI0025C02039|nr:MULTISPECIES: AraC family transcriptional regulator [unclassified Flavobacterium]